MKYKFPLLEGANGNKGKEILNVFYGSKESETMSSQEIELCEICQKMSSKKPVIHTLYRI